MNAPLTEREFSRHVNTAFQAKLEDGQSVDLKLVQVKPYRRNNPEETGREQFSAFFVGDAGLLLPQRTYTLQHDEMGELEIFLVPVARKEEGYHYEAVFNYFINPQSD